MQAFWQAGLALAGIGAVGSFVLWSLYRQWLRLPIFQQLTKEQLYKLFVLFLVLTFIFAVLTVGAYVFVQWSGAHKTTQDASADELIDLIRNRRAAVLALIDARERKLDEEKKLPPQAASTKDPEGDQQRLRDISARFQALSDTHIRALENRHFVESHETLIQIHVLLDDPKTQELFREPAYYGDDKQIKYVPRRVLAEKFFHRLPDNLQGMTGSSSDPLFVED